MKHNEGNQFIILQNLLQIPQKILSVHGMDNLTDLVLHELCDEKCLNIDRAAYFVDNPDFNCLKGVAGYCNSEKFKHTDIWQDESAFTEYIRHANFNSKIRSFSQNSFTKAGQKESDIVSLIAQQLEFTNYGYCTWNMKHDNHGLFVYNKSDNREYPSQDIILQGLHLLGFCPLH